jgi:hypothetical protein
MTTYASAKSGFTFSYGKVSDLLAKIVSGQDRAGAQFTIGAPVVRPVNTVAASGAAQTIVNNAFNHITLSANCTFTFPTATAGSDIIIALKQDATGSRLVTWPSTVKWPAGTAPTLSTGAAKVDVVTLRCLDGTNWLASATALDVR